VEGHKYNFSLRIPNAKLDLDLTNELCQTVGDELFFYFAYLFKRVGKTQDLPISKI
jgi:hypothetical protein